MSVVPPAFWTLATLLIYLTVRAAIHLHSGVRDRFCVNYPEVCSYLADRGSQLSPGDGAPPEYYDAAWEGVFEQILPCDKNRGMMSSIGFGISDSPVNLALHILNGTVGRPCGIRVAVGDIPDVWAVDVDPSSFYPAEHHRMDIRSNCRCEITK